MISMKPNLWDIITKRFSKEMLKSYVQKVRDEIALEEAIRKDK